MPDTERRPLRVCDACGGIDDGPRHSWVDEANPSAAPDPAWLDAVIASDEMTAQEKRDAVAVLMDLTWQMRHMSCCRQEGCPTGDCNDLPDLEGDELLAHIQGA